MKFFEKISEYKAWDEKYSFKEHLIGGVGIGATLSTMGAAIQQRSINKKIKAIQHLKPNYLRAAIKGGIFGGLVGLGQHFYEQEKYTK
jgi:hypothetical protein